ncbi:hydrogen peroxide-inducible genes activator [Cochlodiniinecator piscidefendens]|uniref:hydrogen peroxide-inducible genes activator n=1 Tax=Cochlodiniinecator piscidefendens TaxID=2715756 RepID=UPI00140776FC|nr:hydrogen peroxide-inducible genes activator [Cochlodiniinecator piscidefendens]
MKHTSVAGLSIRDIEYVQAIASEGHFGRAAVLCGVSQPAISQQVQKLEAKLGIVIFERQGKHISVTENGKVFLKKADIILSTARELLELSSSLSSPMEGELRLGVIPTLGPYLMPLVLKAIKAVYPKLRLSLYEEPTETLEQLLAERKLDVILLATAPKTSSFDTVDIFFEPYIFATPEASGLKPEHPVTWPQITSSQLVLLSAEHCMRDQTIALCDLQDKQGQRMASSLEMLRQMVALGDGSALLPALSVTGNDAFGGLLTLHSVSDGKFGRQIQLLWRNSDPRAQHLNAFGAFLGDQMNTPQMQKRLQL